MASVKRRETTRGPRYDVRYRTPVGEPRMKTLRTRKDADRFANTVEADKLRGAWIDPRQAAVTVAEAADRWLDSNPGKRSTTWARDEAIVRRHVKLALGTRGVGTVTRLEVQALVNAWSEDMAPRTVRRTFGVLRAILNCAVDLDLIVRTPCRGVKLPAVTQKRRHVIDADELASLATAVGKDYEAMIYVGAVLGLRWGECAGLRVGRLDVLRSTLTVAEQITRGARGAAIVAAPKSSAGCRTLQVPRVVMSMLAAHLEHRGLTAADADVLVFTSPTGAPLDYSHFRRRVWIPACSVVGLDGYTFHDLRRANATAMVLEGVDLKTAQTRLGHSDPRLTLAIYAQATTEADRVAAARLGEHFISTEDRDDVVGILKTIEAR